MVTVLHVERTNKSPYVHFDAEEGHFEIKGVSIPEDSEAFYRPLIAFAEKYNKNPAPKTVVAIKFLYFNTSTSDYLLSLVRTLKEGQEEKLTIEWHYEEEDEDMYETGTHIEKVLEHKFVYCPCESIK